MARACDVLRELLRLNRRGSRKDPCEHQEGFEVLRTRWILTALSAAVIIAAPVGSNAQKKSYAETKLVGIKLYDTGVHVVSLYGSPNAIVPVSAGGAGGPSGGRGPAAGGARGGAGASSPPGAGQAAATWDTPAGFGDAVLGQMTPGMIPGKGGGAAPSGPAGAGAPPIPGRGNQGGNGAGNTPNVEFTRWVYDRANCEYDFILDKYSHVIQIEATGIHNAKVRTLRGITFGATFAQLIKKYPNPEGYDINGDTVIVRYLVNNKVAFRLSRLGPDKPLVVTGIAVAAGKHG